MTIERPMFPPRGESVDSFSPQPGIRQPEAGRPAGESPKAVGGLSRRSVFGALAVLPVGLPTVAAEPDPIFAAIARHKAAMLPYDAAVHARSVIQETKENYDKIVRLEDAVDDAYEQCCDAGVDFINTEPTTLAGIIAAIQHIRTQMRDDGTYMPHDLVLETGGDARETMGWIDAFLSTVNDALAGQVRS